jgi:hypothetical protein
MSRGRRRVLAVLHSWACDQQLGLGMSTQMDTLRVCIDRHHLPRTHGERMALLKTSTWQSGASIRIRFLNGDPGVHERVRRAARIWTGFANIKFFFGDDPNSQIRISFQGRGSWSYLGTQCLDIQDPDVPTMNFGWLTPQSSDEEVEQVVLHEFGHALGCIHEHQHPTNGIAWNKPVIYSYYSGPPNHWTREQVDKNLFELYAQELTEHSSFDPKSIMLYPIPVAFTTDGTEVGFNHRLSETDKAFIRKLYP